MSRRRASLSPSLFPFLAVLVCTLGTLILLLALVAEKAQDTSVPQVAQHSEAVAPTLDPSDDEASTDGAADPSIETDGPPAMTAASAIQLLEEEQFRVEQLVLHREKQTSKVERRRDELTQVQTATKKLRDRLKQLSDEVDAAIAPEDATKIDEQAIVMMREEMETLRREIAELEEVKSGDKPRVVIVPHRGPNGTARRPVYVECTENGVTIWPEDTRITHTQLLAGVQSGSPRRNPLDAALRVFRQHAVQNYGDGVPPYPLLIVRPDGIETFVTARAAMQDWDDQYGYELVPAEFDLAFPKPDRVLKPKMELAVHEASSRNIHQYIGDGRGGTGGNGNGTQSVAGATLGGAASRPSGNGFANADAFSAKPSDGTFASGGTGNNGGPTDNPYAGQPGGATSQLGGTTTSSMQPAEKPLPVLSARSLDRQARANGFMPSREMGPPLPAGGLAEPIPGSSQSSFGAVETRSDALNDYLAQKDNPLLGAPQSDANQGPSANSNWMDEQSADGTDGESDADQSDPNFRGASSKVNGEQVAGMQQPSGGQSASASVSQSSASPPSSSQAPESADQPPPSTNMQAPQQPTQTVRREGRDWALPRSMAGINGTQVVRPIAMVCHHDRYELVQNNVVVQTFPFGNDSIYNATMKLATAVRDRVDGWGATLPGGRWQPRLDVLVAPHADQRFHDLQTLMNGSGVEITRRVR